MVVVVVVWDVLPPTLVAGDKTPQDNLGHVSPVPSVSSVGGCRQISPASSVGEYLQTAGMPEDIRFQLEPRRMEMGREKRARSKESADADRC